MCETFIVGWTGMALITQSETLHDYGNVNFSSKLQMSTSEAQKSHELQLPQLLLEY